MMNRHRFDPVRLPAAFRSTTILCCLLLVVVSIGTLQGCSTDEPSPPPSPVALESEDMGYYCMMGISEHDGPKAQIHLAEVDHPIWFSQVRDAIAYLRSPEETDRVQAVYVNDMGKALSWDDPGENNWIAANSAQFVINSNLKGGMGAPEAIPFGTETDADAFIEKNGGTRVMLAEIPSDYVLSAVQIYLNAQEQKK